MARMTKQYMMAMMKRVSQNKKLLITVAIIFAMVNLSLFVYFMMQILTRPFFRH